jgi:hypothetical protein
MKTLSPLVLAAALALAGAAAAQAPEPSPEMQAAREAMRQACAADLKTACPGKVGREAMMCLRGGADKLSAGCKDAIAKMPHRPRPE